jgi:multisubunit Na+/H+ antiporter MnhG subunit
VNWRSVAAVVLLIAGTGVGVVAALGVTVMRDWQDRLHYAGLSTYAVVLVALSILVRESFSLIGDKALLVAAIMLFSAPVMVHATMRSGRIRTLGDWRRNVDSELGPQ